MLGINDWMELTGYWWPKNWAATRRWPRRVAKVITAARSIATGSATSDGSIVLGHTSFTDFWQGQFENVILDLTPAEGNRMVMQTAPGWTLGA